MNEDKLMADAERAYVAAVAMRDRIRDEWKAAGEPIFWYHPRSGRAHPHPLLKLLAEADRHVIVMRKPLLKRRKGRPPECVGQPLDGTL